MDKITDIQIKSLEDNLKLAYYIANKWDKKLFGILDKEEIISICLIGLTKSILHYNCDLATFGTYASRVMDNEVKMALRKTRNKVFTIPISDLTYLDDTGNYTTYKQINALVDPHNNIEQWVEIKTFNDAFKTVRFKEREILGMYLNGVKQKEIANIKGFSQSYISRVICHGFTQLKKEMQKE